MFPSAYLQHNPFGGSLVISNPLRAAVGHHAGRLAEAYRAGLVGEYAKVGPFRAAYGGAIGAGIGYGVAGTPGAIAGGVFGAGMGAVAGAVGWGRTIRTVGGPFAKLGLGIVGGGAMLGAYGGVKAGSAAMGMGASGMIGAAGFGKDFAMMLGKKVKERLVGSKSLGISMLKHPMIAVLGIGGAVAATSLLTGGIKLARGDRRAASMGMGSINDVYGMGANHNNTAGLGLSLHYSQY